MIDDVEQDPRLSPDTWAEHAYAAGWTDAENPHRPIRVRATFAFIHPTAVIGPRTIVFPQAYIGPNVEIGADCVIGPGACIGQPGFGYWPIDGAQAYRQHVEGVRIGDDVHIGANTCIDQGRHRPTRIGRGSRIDDLCFVAHNVQIGHNVLVIAQTMIAGSTEIGDDCHIGPSAMISDHITVGARARVGLGAVVIRDVPENVIVVGNPARVLRERGADE